MLSFYLRALYFGTCNLTGLGKDLIPVQTAPVVFTLACFLSGVMVFAYLTSAIVTLTMNADPAAIAFKEKKRTLLGFMQAARIEAAVVRRAQQWLDHWWHAHGGMEMGSVIDSLLPPSLGFAMRRQLLWEHTQCTPLFDHFWDGAAALDLGEHTTRARALSVPEAAGGGRGTCEEEDGITSKASQWEAALRRLIAAMTFEVYNPGEWVLRKGMLNDKFFVVAVGQAEVLLEDTRHRGFSARRASLAGASAGSRIIASLGAGDIFGEISCLYLKKCEASVRARTALDVISLPRSPMMDVLHLNERMRHDLLHLVGWRRQENSYLMGGKPNDIASAARQLQAARALGRFARRCLKAKREKLHPSGSSWASVSA